VIEIQYLHRGRFRELPGAAAVHVRANAWLVTVPTTPEVRRIVGAEVTPEVFDDSTWLIGDLESVSAMGAGATPTAVTVSVLLP
jgi:hypothetical protein